MHPIFFACENGKIMTQRGSSSFLIILEAKKIMELRETHFS